MGGTRLRHARGLAALPLLALVACGAADEPAASASAAPAFLFARHAAAAQLSGAPVFEAHSDGGVTRAGLRLPAGSSAAWEVDVPAGARLELSAAALGATGALSVEVGAGDADARELGPARLDGAFARQGFSLAEWSGRRVWVRFTALPAETGPAPALFLQEPALYVPREDPRRWLLVFVDTLRADHLGFYGYGRDTSPNLDRVAREAAVFEAAYAPSPWTLPSARAALSGRQPEAWRAGPNLAERLGAAGVYSAAVAANSFLGPAFGMERGFSEHRVGNKLPAGEVVERALALLERFRDRDLLLLVHLMDPHLPYREPPPYRALFGDETAEREFLRGDLLDLDPSAPGFAERVVQRYDQSIRYADDALAPLLDAVGPAATLVFFSDHGEEFWEHGGVEHGHAFWNELLRVPLFVRDAAVPAGRQRAPVSLLDVTPTVLDLAGLAPEAGPGRSLLPLARGERGAESSFAARPLAFGRPLYGGDGWGVLAGGRKWWSRGGAQSLFDQEGDPAESADLARSPEADLARYPAALAEALGREVRLVWRVALHSPPGDEDVVVTLSHPSGFERAWIPFDPRERERAVRVRVADGRVVVSQPAGVAMPRAVYALPSGSARDPRGLEARIEGGGRAVGGAYDGPARVEPSGAPPPLLRVGDAGRGLIVLLAWTPLPGDEESFDLSDDAVSALRELGYLE